MPNRIIRDSCKTSPSLAVLSDLAERTFWRIIATLDDFGRYHGSTMALLAATYPVPTKGVTQKRFEAAVDELAAGGLIKFYEHGGRRYVMSPTWQKYQRLRARDSQFPEPLCFVGGGHRAATCPPDDGQVAVISPPSAAGVGDGIGVGNGDGDGPRPTPLEGFEVFWNSYPKKKNKGDAEKAWLALRPRPDLRSRILEALTVQRESRDWLKDGGKWVPYPASWLRGKRWEDVSDVVPFERAERV